MSAGLLRMLGALAVTGAAAAGFVYGWPLWVASRSVQATDNAYVRGEITVLSPRVAGYAVAILADDNEPVRAKQVVVRIDPRDFRSALQRAEAALLQARAALTQAERRKELQLSQIAVANAALVSARAQAENADLGLARARELLSRGAGTQARFDDATAAATAAAATVESASATLEFQRRDLGVLDADIETARARIADAEAQVGAARIALEDTEVWAPLDGIVANRRTRVGEYVTVGTRMLSIVPRDGLWIEANYRETQLAHMRAGDPVAVSVDMYRGARLCGYVESLGPASGSEFALVPPDNATGNFTKIVRRFPVRIRLNASEARADLIRPGLSVVVRAGVDAGRGETPEGRAQALGCRFDPAADIKPAPLRTLPPHPGLQSSAGPAGAGTP